LREFITMKYVIRLFVGIVAVGLLLVTLSGCGVSDDDGAEVQLPSEEADRIGEVTLNEPLSNTDVTFRVEGEDGQPLSGHVVVFVSDGERYDALTYDPTGAHLPALYFGALRGQTAQRAGLSFLSPRSVYAFEPFTIAIRVIGLEAGTVAFAPMLSTGHFQFELMFDGFTGSICPNKHEFGTDSEVLNVLVSAKTGIIGTLETLSAWAALDVSIREVTQALADRIYDGLDPDTRYRMNILTTKDGYFTLFDNTEEVCDPARR
jgi:hypothetical protein